MGAPASATPTTSSGTTPTTQSGGTPTQQGGVPNPMLQQMMAQAFGAGGQQNPAPNVESQQLAQAEVLYQSQLEQLANMGFTNRQANLRGRLWGSNSSEI